MPWKSSQDTTRTDSKCEGIIALWANLDGWETGALWWGNVSFSAPLGNMLHN